MHPAVHGTSESGMSSAKTADGIRRSQRRYRPRGSSIGRCGTVRIRSGRRLLSSKRSPLAASASRSRVRRPSRSIRTNLASTRDDLPGSVNAGLCMTLSIHPPAPSGTRSRIGTSASQRMWVRPKVGSVARTTPHVLSKSRTRGASATGSRWSMLPTSNACQWVPPRSWSLARLLTISTLTNWASSAAASAKKSTVGQSTHRWATTTVCSGMQQATGTLAKRMSSANPRAGFACVIRRPHRSSFNQSGALETESGYTKRPMSVALRLARAQSKCLAHLSMVCTRTKWASSA
mmetsp:Transcript_16157/g.32411  ORF Transcript_16157/g.32411 Transcript_16157/m.32411 type:complete len:291 (+) Transcript_16157:585-1457(+)